MGVRGDLAAALTSKGYDLAAARDLLTFIFNTADDPDFAYKFADEYEERGTTQHNDKMLDYWDVIKFVKNTI